MGISAHYPSLLHVTRKLNKKRHTHCAAHQETQLHSVEKLFALGHSRSDQATAKRRPSSAKSHKPPAANAVVTELSRSARLVRTIAPRMCRALRTAQTHECLPNVFQDALRAARGGQPADVPTPREQKNTESGHTHRFSNLQRERWTQKKKRRRAWILPSARRSWPTNGYHKLNQSEVRRQSARNGPNIQLSPSKNSWIKSHVI